jgi:hypothetical protein
MTITRHYIEWLALMPTSGPLLSEPVFTQAFTQELDLHDADLARHLRIANQRGHHYVTEAIEAITKRTKLIVGRREYIVY